MMQTVIARYRRPTAAIPVLIAAAVLGLRLLMPVITIDLRSVHVSDAPTAAQATVHVDRRIRFPFVGRYYVSFQRVGGTLACNPVWSQPIDYRGGLDGEIDKSLVWWVGEATLRDCVAEGLRDGRFVMTTCHYWLLSDTWGLAYVPLARRCVRSNEFELWGDG